VAFPSIKKIPLANSKVKIYPKKALEKEIYKEEILNIKIGIKNETTKTKRQNKERTQTQQRKKNLEKEGKDPKKKKVEKQPRG